jgi:hypothetical protein
VREAACAGAPPGIAALCAAGDRRTAPARLRACAPFPRPRDQLRARFPRPTRRATLPLPFAVTDASKLNVTVLEAVSLDDVDPEAVKTGLAQYSAAYASATEDVAKSEAEIVRTHASNTPCHCIQRLCR